jgi:hypothetical protein
MRAARCVILLAAAAALAACSNATKQVAVDPNLYPSDYQQELLQTLRTSLDVPTNVRDAAISEPVLRAAGQDRRYSVCVRANSRDISGSYTGVKEHIGWFWGGHLNQLVEANPGQCAGAAYRPWPELEKLCQATKCT